MPAAAKPRVAYLVGRYPTVSHTFILREVLALRELGVEVDTFSIHRSGAEQLLADADREEAARTFSFLPLRPFVLLASHVAALVASPAAYAALAARAFGVARPGLRGRFLAATWVAEAPMLWWALRRRGIAHVHAHLPGTAPTVAMLATEFANRVRGRRPPSSWSLTIHGPAEFYEVGNQALPEKLGSADFAAAISDFGRSQLMAFSSEDDWPRLHVVHCGIDPSAYAPRIDEPGDGRPVRLVTVGRLSPVKGHALLIEAIARLRDRGVQTRLEIIGDGPKRAALERLVDRFGLRDVVVLTGPVGQDEIAEHYRRADLYVHASFAEGIPVVLMEAMAHRLPVVATSVMGVGELVHHERTGLLVRPGRIDQLTQAIEQLAGDADRRRAFGEAGRRIVEAEFDVRASAARLRDLFAECRERATAGG